MSEFVDAVFKEFESASWNDNADREIAEDILLKLDRVVPENKPLTLEQLQQMDGEPVYTIAIGPGCFTGWEIIAGFGIGPDGEKTIRLCNTSDGLYDTDEDLYGKTWLAYRQKPVSK